MREIIFRKQNKQKWEKIESIFSNRDEASSDQLAHSYIEIMNDLSYASTYYPNSRTVEYLNNFASKLHNLIYINKKEEQSRFLQFWKFEIPLIVKKNHHFFLYSLLTFLFFVALGMVSQYYDKDFARSILGDQYVEMTIHNIEKGDAMGVYKQTPPFLMFISILTNNFLVMLRTIALGAIPILGTLYVIASNGIMVGTFLFFFIQNDLVWESFRTIFIHGTVELISIVIAGAASFIIGKSILFPGTYSRLYSFTTGVKDAIKLGAGLVPFILLAAFIESYITRYTNMPNWLAIAIIALSLLLMVYYYIIYPLKLNATVNKKKLTPILEVKDL